MDSSFACQSSSCKSGSEYCHEVYIDMKVFNTDHSELMDVIELEREGNNLVIRGNIMQSMPIRCIVTPSEVRGTFKLVRWKLFFFLLTMPFRS